MTLFYAAVALGIAAAGWVVLPVLQRRMALAVDRVPGGVLDARARRRVALASLKEVEYDRAGGKLDEEDYARLKGQLEREALLAIRAAEQVDDPAASAQDGYTVTHACGFANPPASRFCAGCGARL